MRACWWATRSASITPRSSPQPRASSTRRTLSTLLALAARRLDREPVARILGGKEFWGLPLDISDGHAGAAAGNRDRGRSGARRDRRRRPAHAHAADRRSRHRLGRAAAGAARRAAERVSAIGTDVSAARSRSRATMPSGSGWARARALSVCDFGAALARRLRSRGINPPYIATARDRRARARGPPRSAPRARRRRRRPRLLSRHRWRCLAPARARGPSGGRARIRSGRERSPRLFAGGRPCRPAGAARSCRYPARAAGECCHNDAMSVNIADRQKSTWIIGRNRLASRHGIDPRVMPLMPGAMARRGRWRTRSRAGSDGKQDRRIRVMLAVERASGFTTH